MIPPGGCQNASGQIIKSSPIEQVVSARMSFGTAYRLVQAVLRPSVSDNFSSSLLIHLSSAARAAQCVIRGNSSSLLLADWRLRGHGRRTHIRWLPRLGMLP